MAQSKRNKKKKVGCLIGVLIVVAILLVVIFSARRAGQKILADSVYTGDLFTVAVRNVSDTVSATGLIKSEKDATAKVYSTLSYKINKVNVELGDRVAKDDVLCVYETETLDRMIREKELSMSSSDRASALNLASAKLNYESFRTAMEAGTNASIHNAESALSAAEENYQRALKDYNDYAAKIENGEIISLVTAKRNLDQAQADYDDFASEIDENTNLSLNAAVRRLENAKADYEDLKTKIEKKTHSSIVTAKRTLDSAKKTYEDYRSMVKYDETDSLIKASAAVSEAYSAYKTANEALKQLKADLAAAEAALAGAEEPTEEEKAALKAAVEKAKEKVKAQEAVVEKASAAHSQADDAYDAAYRLADHTLSSYKTAYENAQDNYDATLDSLNTQLESYARAVKDAQDNYDSIAQNLDDTTVNYARALSTAKENYQNVKESVDTQLENYEHTLSAAKRSLEDAGNSLENARTGAADTLENYRISYENAKNSTNTSLADYQLANLYVDLGKTEVKAPIDGTVTAVYAVEGESATGVLFVIENTEKLVVESTVKAYDLDRVAVGMNVKIKTDATGSDVFPGVLESVAPTAVKDASGGVKSTNDAEFETVVRITVQNDRLKIGVSARIEYVTAEAPEAAAVPESAIFEEDGKTYVLVAVEQPVNAGEPSVSLEKVAVECGVSDGVYVEVRGISIGDVVVDNVKNYQSYEGRTVALSNIDKNASVFDMNAMMNRGR